VASLIRIPLAPADIAAILLGDVRLQQPPAAAAAASTVSWDGERGADVLTVAEQNGWLRLLWQREGGRPRLVAVTALAIDGSTRWRVAFEDFADADAPTPAGGATRVPLPRIVRYAEANDGFDDG